MFSPLKSWKEFLQVLLCPPPKLPICFFWSKAVKINGEQQCQISVQAAWEKNGRIMKGTLRVLCQERRSLFYSFKMKIKPDTQWETHVKVEQVCCTFVKGKQAQVFLGSTNLSILCGWHPSRTSGWARCVAAPGNWPGFQSGLGPGSSLWRWV